jgi:prepilin-type N-terminal cleavage/methylation domain-containing protein
MKKGFTLIELLVVISIIGILASLALVSYSAAQKQTRGIQRKSDLSQLRTSLEAYYSANNAYPSTGGQWWGECSHPWGQGGLPRTGPDGYIPGLAPDFIEELPQDPRHEESYPPCNNGNHTCYLYKSNGYDYKLLAHCSPENYPTNHPFYDPTRQNHAWQVHSTNVSKDW